MLYKNTLGIIGGGQLGKMIAIAASKLGYSTHIFTNNKNDPACHVTNCVTIADFSDDDKIKSFAKSVSSVTIESENIPCSIIDIVSEYVDCYPGKKALYIAQNRLREKDFIRSLNIQTANYRSVQSYRELKKSSEIFHYPMRLKTAEMGYDGKGQYVINESSKIKQFASFNWDTQHILEESVDLLKEISIVIAMSNTGEITFFPIAENCHTNGILNTSTVPAKIDYKIAEEVQEIARKIAHSLDLTGILAIEFFISKHNKLLVNELAPRPHNSCHWSLDACNISQFEQLVRVIYGLPTQEVKLYFPCMTKNILGYNIHNINSYLTDKRSSLTVYGKQEVRNNRKMGHVNLRSP